MNSKKYDVVGIGNAIVDVISHCDDVFLQNQSMRKGSMELIDKGRAEELYSKMGPATECSGGSVANSLAGLAQLGAKTAFIGCVKDDQLGKIFRHDMESIGIDFVTPAKLGGKPTATCMIFVTPDGERTMNTYIGACADLQPEDIDPDAVTSGKFLLIEGYLWDQEPAKQAIRQALQLAKEAGSKLVFSLSDVFCVERHRVEFGKLVEHSLDILFANEKELMSLYQTDLLADALASLRQKIDLAFITRHELGSVVVTADEIIEIPAVAVNKVVDSTGAGDLYAAGVLYGLAQGWSPQKAAGLGSRCAADIIQQMGARATQPLARHVAA